MPERAGRMGRGKARDGPAGRRAADARRVHAGQRRSRQSPDPRQLPPLATTPWRRRAMRHSACPTLHLVLLASPSSRSRFGRLVGSAGPHRGHDQRHRHRRPRTSRRARTARCTSAARRRAPSTAPRRARRKPNPGFRRRPTGLTNVLGVLADDKTNTLWVCQNNTGGRGGAPVVGQTALRSFDLKSGAAKGTYPFPTNGGVCNDMAVAPDGTVYATESFANRIHRLRPGAKALDLWISGSAAGRCRRRGAARRWRRLRQHLLQRQTVPHSGERGRQRRRAQPHRDVASAHSARRAESVGRTRCFRPRRRDG